MAQRTAALRAVRVKKKHTSRTFWKPNLFTEEQTAASVEYNSKPIQSLQSK